MCFAKRKPPSPSAIFIFFFCGVTNGGYWVSSDAVPTTRAIRLRRCFQQVAMQPPMRPTTLSTPSVTRSQETSYPAHRHLGLAQPTSLRPPPQPHSVTRQPSQLCARFPFGHPALPRQWGATTPAYGPLTAVPPRAPAHLTQNPPPPRCSPLLTTRATTAPVVVSPTV